MTFGLKPGADRADAAVHHVRRGDDVGPSGGLDERLRDELLGGLVVEDIARLVGQAVVAVRGVGVERDIGQDTDLGHRVLDGADRAAHEVVGVERFLAHFAAQVRRGVGEEGDARDAEVAGFAGAVGEAIDRPAADPGKRRDRLLPALPLGDEQGPDEIGGREVVLGEHGADPRSGPAAAHADCWEGGLGHACGVAREMSGKKAGADH